MIPLGPVVARSRVRASRAAVWATVIDPELRQAWWPELQLEPRLGGSVAERWTETSGDTAVTRDASGDVDVWVEGHAIGFRWSEAGDEHSTAVLVTLRSQGPETGITVTETGFDALPSPAERAAASQDGWQVLLADLVASVEAAVAAGTFADDSATADVSAVENEAEAASEEETEEESDAEEVSGAEAETEAVSETDTDSGAGSASEAASLDDDDDDDDVSNETVKIERLVVPSPTETSAADVELHSDVTVDSDAVEPDSGAEESESGGEDPAPDPEEPDFDTLIRGPQPR